VGTDQNSTALKKPASVFERAIGSTRGVDTETNKRNYMIGAIVFGVMTIVSGSRWAKSNGYNGGRDKSWAASTIVLLSLASVSTWLYVQEDKIVVPSGSGEGMHGAGQGKRRALMRDNLGSSGGTAIQPRQTDQLDVNPYPKMDDPANGIQARMDYAGVDTNKLEGPRSNIGYRRSPATADKRSRLKARDLMRSAGNYNMDDGTFDEYMARMDGETPNQFHQTQPYMPFAADWDKAHGEIDDSNRYFGIGDSPSQSNRRWVYKEPRMQQGGARTMHTKDPPPGSVNPVSKIHPWLDVDQSGVEGPVMLGGEVRENEKLTGTDTGQFFQERMREGRELDRRQPRPSKRASQRHNNYSQGQDHGQMQEQQKRQYMGTGDSWMGERPSTRTEQPISSDPSSLPVREVFPIQSAPPDEPIDTRDDPFGEKPRRKMSNLTTPTVPRRKSLKRQPSRRNINNQEQDSQQGYADSKAVLSGNDSYSSSSEEDNYSSDTDYSSEDEGGLDTNEEGGTRSFFKAFRNKRTPDEDEIKRAELDVRRD
jgi:hypothetical protein